MLFWLVVLIGAGLFGGAFLGLRPVALRLLARAVAREDAAPIPPPWLAVIERKVPAVRALDLERRNRLLHAVRNLITTRRWEGCGGLVLTMDMQLIIAAQACLLTLELPGEPYPSLRTVLVYPHTFVPRRLRDLRKWRTTDEEEPPRPQLGEAWRDGTIVLAWDSALAGATNPGDGRNVVIHEFAHQLAFERDLTPLAHAGGLLIPQPGSFPGGADAETWQRVLEESYERLCAKLEAGTDAVLDEYAATDQAEFFAVATEVFFEKPRELRAAYPQLYEQLQKLYRQDPAGSQAYRNT